MKFKALYILNKINKKCQDAHYITVFTHKKEWNALIKLNNTLKMKWEQKKYVSAKSKNLKGIYEISFPKMISF